MNPQRGAVTRFDSANVLRGIAASRTGEIISLNLPLDDPHTGYGRRPFSRETSVHNMFIPIGEGRYMVVNDDEVSFALQGSSHWDSLAHVGISTPEHDGIYYGDATIHETFPEPTAPNLGIQAMGSALVTRGVLVDVVAPFAEGKPYLDPGFRITRAVLEECLDRQAVDILPGDAVLIFTGFEALRAANGGEYPATSSGLDGSTVPLWIECDVQALISDNPAVESQPNDHAVHEGMLVGQGVPLGELWALETLAEACRGDGRYDFTLASVPLNISGAFGSPANAIAIR